MHFWRVLKKVLPKTPAVQYLSKNMFATINTVAKGAFRGASAVWGSSIVKVNIWPAYAQHNDLNRTKKIHSKIKSDEEKFFCLPLITVSADTSASILDSKRSQRHGSLLSKKCTNSLIYCLPPLSQLFPLKSLWEKDSSNIELDR